MKKSYTSIILCLSLILNMILIGIYYDHKDNQSNTAYYRFKDEIRFAIQRLEDYQEEPTESSYRVATSHLYTALQMLELIETNDQNKVLYMDSFHQLWNVVVLYPEEVEKHSEELIEILTEFRAGSDLKDLWSISRLNQVTQRIRDGVE